jgi:glycerophosphoryl diester phosphodiesterase
MLQSMGETSEHQELAEITHIFTISGLFPNDRGARPEDALAFQHFTSNVRSRPDIGIRVLDLGTKDRLTVRTAVAQLENQSLSLMLWFDRFGLGQLHVTHSVSADPTIIAEVLDLFCHGRTTLTIEGVPFLDWVQREAELQAAPSLAQDVLDFVHFPADRLGELVSEHKPTQGSLRIVYRKPKGSSTTAAGIRMPPDLNRGGESFAAHGRGVVLLCGHTEHRRLALRLTAAELLFAIARARQSRSRLEVGLRDNRWGEGVSASFDLTFLQELADIVRHERIRLAVDVKAAVDGLFMPESVLDDFRASLGSALRFEELTNSSQDLANTLSDVVSSYLEEAKFKVAADDAARERNWQLIVGIGSGVALPIALLLSYFGVSSQVTAPSAVSIFDLGAYWLPYLVTGLSVVAVLLASVLGYVRARRRGQVPDARAKTTRRDVCPVMISAHRSGAGNQIELENTKVALDAALKLNIDFVEFDVQRCADGTFVLFHDDHIEVGGERSPLADLSFEEFASSVDHFLRYDEALAALAAAGKRAHIDFKFKSPPSMYADPVSTFEVDATKVALQVLGAANIIVTTLEDCSVLAVRTWATEEGIELLVGLSLGRSRVGLSKTRAARQVFSELFPRARIRRSRANLVVAQRTLARATLARFARRRGLPLLVWTVDDEVELAYWLRPGRAWLVTTNVPAKALAVRDRHLALA